MLRKQNLYSTKMFGPVIQRLKAQKPPGGRWFDFDRVLISRSSSTEIPDQTTTMGLHISTSVYDIAKEYDVLKVQTNAWKSDGQILESFVKKHWKPTAFWWGIT